MPYIQCSFYSECLGKPANVIVVLPKQANMAYARKFPVVYLLHGLMNAYDDWFRRTALERYCDEQNIAAVLPEAGRSFYCDMTYGDAVYTHLVDELIPFCQSVFPLADDPAHRFVAGVSMGGYGAYKLALKNPGLFSKAASLSGVMDIGDMIAMFPEYEKDWMCCFGGKHAPAEEDLFHLLETAKAVPQLYQWCGTYDFLYAENQRFREFATARGIALHYEEQPGAMHDWNFWDPQLPHLLQWLQQTDR